MAILATGGAGFIGAEVVRTLVDRGSEKVHITYHSGRLQRRGASSSGSARTSWTWPTEDSISDVTLQRPDIVYGVSKVFGELLGRYYRIEYGLDLRGIATPAAPPSSGATPGALLPEDPPLVRQAGGGRSPGSSSLVEQPR